MIPDNPHWGLRAAVLADSDALEALIRVCARALLSACYSAAQIEAARGPVFCLDRQLICDGTYFVAESGRQIVGCDGWSRRNKPFGGESGSPRDRAELNPTKDSALMRAFFVHPAGTLRRNGKTPIRVSEAAAAAGFRAVELVTTLPGEPMCASLGYRVVHVSQAPLPGGLRLPVVRIHKRF